MIKEFDLDFPDASKKLRHEFRNKTRCVTSLFEKCYQPTLETGKSWKILVELVNEITKPKIRNLLGVLVVQVVCSVHELTNSKKNEELELVLKKLMCGISQVARENEWSLLQFFDAERKVLERKFVNEWTWRPKIANKTKTLFAELVILHDSSKASISVRFSNLKNEELSVVHLINTEPNEFIFSDFLGNLKWSDETSIDLFSRSGDRKLTARYHGNPPI